MLGGLRIRLAVRALTTVLFATGTVWWWAAAVGSTWYFAHIVAVIFALAAPSASPCATTRGPTTAPVRRDEAPDDGTRSAARAPPSLAARPLAGACGPPARASRRRPACRSCSAAPFLILVGGGGDGARRRVSAAVGGVLPVAALLAVHVAHDRLVLHPGYDYQYQLEANGYPTLGYHPDWSVEDLRYIPQNLGIMFGALPVVAPDLKPNTLGFGDPVVLCTAPGAPAVAVRPRLPAASCRSTSAPASC